MNSDKKAVDQFLIDAKMHPESLDIESTVNHMMDEMHRGLVGDPSSLPMIPTYIDADPEIPANRRVIVLDAGGTNLRAAVVSFEDNGKPRIEDFSKHPMPGTRGETVGKEEFFDSLAALVEPLISKGDGIGFCFSYPTEMNPNKDGRLIHWSKEIKAPEVEGRMIGSDLKDALRNRGVKEETRVIILNDTVATLLTGKASSSSRPWGGYVGFILGTGSNTAYFESNAEIGKAANLDPAAKQIINCESGAYAVRDRGEADILFGDSTAKPESFWLEKMLSGAYFGPLATETAFLAGRRGLFSADARRALEELGAVSTKDADNYCHNPTDGRDNAVVAAMQSAGNSSDKQRLWFLFDALLERAARLSAANLAASVLKGPTGDGPLSPCCVTIDGTTYYRYYRFQHRVERYLRPFLVGREKYYETVQVDDAPLIGAAVAALTN